MKRNKSKMSTSNKVLIIAITAITIYTVAAFCLQFMCGQEISPTLTEAFFNAFMVELIALATIKHGKIRKENRCNEDYAEEFEEDYSEEYEDECVEDESEC